jgi:hypothetical protein
MKLIGGNTDKGISMRSFVLVVLLVFLGSLEANPPCWGQAPFGPVGPPMAPYSPVASTPSYSWVWSDGDLVPAGWIALHDGSRYVGRLQPDTGLFVWSKTGKQVDLAALVAEHNPSRGARPAGALPISQGPKPEPGVCEPDDAPCGRENCKHCGGKPKPKKEEYLIAQKAEFPPVDQPNPRDKIPQGGVVVEKLSSTEKFTCRGKECTRAEAMAALDAAGSVPDDANALRLTVIGSDFARAKFLTDWKQSPDLAFWRDKFLVTEYLPDHWRIKDGGFKAPADALEPVVYLQKPDGTVLYRLDNWKPGEDAPLLAKALRDKVPGYDPAKDPTPKGSGDSKTKIPPEVLWLVAIGALVAVVLLWRKVNA